VFTFDVDAFRKHCLLNGLDDIGLTLQHVDEIKAYEARRRRKRRGCFDFFQREAQRRKAFYSHFVPCKRVN
jgi:hypothetical protein